MVRDLTASGGGVSEELAQPVQFGGAVGEVLGQRLGAGRL